MRIMVLLQVHSSTVFFSNEKLFHQLNLFLEWYTQDTDDFFSKTVQMSLHPEKAFFTNLCTPFKEKNLYMQCQFSHILGKPKSFS